MPYLVGNGLNEIINNINDGSNNLCKYLCDKSVLIKAKESKFMIINKKKHVGITYDDIINILINSTCL